jgi:hypothetical protein
MTTPSTLVGQPAPSFALKAVATGRVFSPAGYLGRVVLLLFGDHNTGRSAQTVVEHVRRRYPHVTQLAIALVIDARIVPRFARGMAESMMEREYRQAAAQIPSGFDPAEHLILLPDWKGDVLRAYGLANLDHDLYAVAIGADGLVKATYHGPDMAGRALALVSAQLDG